VTEVTYGGGQSLQDGGAAVVPADDREGGDFFMMHPNWLLIAAVLSLWGPLSLHSAHPAAGFALGMDRAVQHVGWHEIQLVLVCSESDPLDDECR
jgi:hypothetical protein